MGGKVNICAYRKLNTLGPRAKLVIEGHLRCLCVRGVGKSQNDCHLPELRGKHSKQGHFWLERSLHGSGESMKDWIHFWNVPAVNVTNELGNACDTSRLRERCFGACIKC